MKLLLLPLLPSVLSFSSGGDTNETGVICDALSDLYGDVTPNENGGKIMWWVQPADHTTDYSLRTADGPPSDDPTSYVPGEWLEIHIRTLVEYKQYTGLLLYAVDENETKVGEWSINERSPYWLPTNPGCDGKAVLHENAAKAPYHQHFQFRPPADMTGEITFRCLIKYGLAFPNTDGLFYWPNERDLVLTQSTRKPENSTWYTGKLGDSCLETCEAVGMGCDEKLVQKVSTNRSVLQEELSSSFPIFEPVLVDCSSSGAYYAGKDFHYSGSTCQEDSTCKASEQGQQRLCPCAGTPLVSSATNTGLRALSMFPLLALLHALTGGSRCTVALPLLCALLLLMPTPGTAHNWINNPSRASKASLTSPCPARKPGAAAHLQVGPGTPFPVEWAAGHSGFSYFVIIKAEDEDKLGLHTSAVLHEYLDNAPDTTSYMADHKKYRVFSGNYNYNVGSPLYPEGVFSGDEITRPTQFSFRFGSTANAAIHAFDDEELHQGTTMRASYKSDKYPWIKAVHAFKITHKNPKEADIANIEIPSGSESGTYVVHWLWRGYRDCVDVEVLDRPSPPDWGINTGFQMLRSDHCQYRKDVMRTDKFFSDCKVVRPGENAAKCYEPVVNNNRGRFAVNVVPWVQPADYKFDSEPNIGVPHPTPRWTGEVRGGRCGAYLGRTLNAQKTGGWTGWFSTDAPTTRDNKDDERRNRNAVNETIPCANPTGIQCRERVSKTMWDHSQDDDNNYCDVERGLFSTRSIDYEARWECPEFNDMDAKVCYYFEYTPAQLEVGDHFEISYDPEDPVFFSTCYVQARLRNFTETCTACKDPPFKPQSVFGDRCVSCEAALQPLNRTRDATWNLLGRDECERCNF